MKKFSLIVLFFMLTFCAVGQRFNGGLVFGICASHLTGTLVDSVSNNVGTKFFSKPGLNVGVYTNLYFDNRSAVDFEISYIQKGSRKVPGASDTLPNQVYQTKTSLHYITLPVHYSYKVSDNISVFTGPNVGIMLRGLCKFEQNYIDFTDQMESYIDAMSKVDFSWDFGVNLKLLQNLSLDIKYSSTFFLTPIRSYNNKDAWKFGPLSKQFWVKGQYNQLFDFTLRWMLFGEDDRARW